MTSVTIKRHSIWLWQLLWAGGSMGNVQ